MQIKHNVKLPGIEHESLPPGHKLKSPDFSTLQMSHRVLIGVQERAMTRKKMGFLTLFKIESTMPLSSTARSKDVRNNDKRVK